MMKFWPLSREGTAAGVPYPLPEAVLPVLAIFARMYETAEYRPPWIGYLASEGDTLVGTCAFKSVPVAGWVEIAYFSFPGHEGKGVATRMAQELLKIAEAEDPAVAVFAQTLPEHGASTRVLQKLGFTWHRSLQHPEDGLVWEWHREPSVRN
ncbi:MAG: GNAT family N-acetyltransferase [Opitutus sp.]